MKSRSVPVFVFALFAFLQGCEAFSSSLQHQRALGQHVSRSEPRLPSLLNNKSRRYPLLNSDSSRNLSILHYSKDERPQFFEESEQRGGVILGFVFLVCVWSFSIPVELRRDHFCFTEKCATNRSRCYDCVTVKEWSGKVKDYYANGGGVQFDFSVEEK